jgi:hypothetical protein
MTRVCGLESFCKCDREDEWVDMIRDSVRDVEKQCRALGVDMYEAHKKMVR